MRGENTVTIWHFDDGADVPEKKVFKRVCFEVCKRISKNGIKQKRFYNGTEAIVRIPTSEEIFVSYGDYLEEGSNNADFLDREKCLKIIEVKDNRRGGQPHWRLFCGG